MAESSCKKEYPEENSCSGSFTLLKGFCQLQLSLDRSKEKRTIKIQYQLMQIVENAARSDIPDIEEKLLPTPFKKKKNSFYASTRPIQTLDPWNRRNANAVMEKAAILIASTNTPAGYKETWRNILNKYKQRIILDAGQLREKHPNCIPVTVEKDARSDIRDIDTKKFLVYGDMSLREFVFFIQSMAWVSTEKPIFFYFRNTKPPIGALMYTIDEENKDEDGFLHITYSGEERVCGSNKEQQEFS
ncbi:uncharacterized protein Pyn_13949 [Prunus yedoensis var. nudiflora]|uniref:Autophagy-related protein n=1 Tax=Prunus yedoensis var. nudiflora TaxID=2094558 RepID=A0A314Y9M3_PRUYE|nr:uncharacterized protein Pyn_13949 [Prunus yedoensis var. nudiflora]